MTNRLVEEITRSLRYKLPLSLLLLDIDHFKRVNDRFGHLIGDKVLISIGKTLQDNTRKSDIAARYGGEELVLVLPNTAEKEAVTFAERLRRILEQIPYAKANIDTDEFRCTVSIGVTSLGEESCSPTDLLHKADVALYHAKRTGRNQVVAYIQEYEENYTG